MRLALVALGALLLLSCARPAAAQVAFGCTTNDAIFDSTSATYSFSSCNVTGSNVYGILSIASDDVAGLPIATGVTWNGVAMTNLKNDQTVTGGNKSLEVWGISAPAAGVTTIAITGGLSSAGNLDYMLCVGTFTGTAGTTGTAVSATGNSGTTSVTVTTPANGMNFIGVSATPSTFTAGAGVTNLGCERGSGTVKGGGGRSTQNTNTYTVSSGAWVSIGVPIDAAAAAVTPKGPILGILP